MYYILTIYLIGLGIFVTSSITRHEDSWSESFKVMAVKLLCWPVIFLKGGFLYCLDIKHKLR